MNETTKVNLKALEGLPVFPNPNYGTGRFRRSILLRQHSDADGQQKVVAELEDNHHAFRIRLFHDSKTVNNITGDAMRYPNTTCPGSLDLFKQLIGTPLDKGSRAFAENHEPRTFCTHLFDLASLAYMHASRQKISAEPTREYQAIVEDEQKGIIQASVSLNGKVIHNWSLINSVIQNEGKAKGISVHSGFMRWVSQHLQGDEQEAAIVLAKSVFVALSRRVDTERLAGTQLSHGFMPKDICYTYRSPVLEQAVHLSNTVIDYSENPQDMLKFVEIL